jgi:hypothetical protein
MRSLCLLLLLANALFLGWAQFIDVQVTDLQHRPVVSNAPPRIVLAREAARAPEPSVETPEQLTSVIAEPPQPAVQSSPALVAPIPASTTPAGVQHATAVCTSVGPFAELPEAEGAVKALRRAGFEPRQREVQGELWVGYWVSVQGLPSRAAAEEAMKRLTDKGMSDVYVLPASESGNVVSLGVFSERQRAQRRADEARVLGLEPRIDDRKKTGAVYWLDVDQPEPVQPVDTSIFQTDPGKIMRLELRECPAVKVE